MELYYSFSILIVLASCFAYLNHRFLKLPSTIGIMIIAMLVSVVLVIFGNSFLAKEMIALKTVMEDIDFTEVLMGAMLNFLLFAGAIHINFNDLKEQKAPIMTFATVSVVISTFVVGLVMYYVLPLIGIEMPFIYCMLFGALISPTDPIAVLSILQKARVSKSLETKVAGESLFNDGIAVVVFVIILKMAEGEGFELTAWNISKLVLQEAGGGLLLGVLLGITAAGALKKIDDYKVSVLITLSVVMGGYLIAHMLHISGPLTMVAAGLYLGNFDKKASKMTVQTKDYLHKFWELVDEIMNAILFLLIGFELIVITTVREYWLGGVIAIGVVLFARLLSIWLPSRIIPFRKRFNAETIKILVWGGLRGGVSIALALSMAPGHFKDQIVSITYIVVVFSIIVQGLTIGKVANAQKVNEEA
ncbi:MAG: sodium:proton antiporter [Bacteroidetes bacterium 47-18]|nr:MAG: sodium:proton antiporter [Bacteroidetes bacterium 47-18]